MKRHTVKISGLGSEVCNGHKMQEGSCLTCMILVLPGLKALQAKHWVTFMQLMEWQVVIQRVSSVPEFKSRYMADRKGDVPKGTGQPDIPGI